MTASNDFFQTIEINGALTPLQAAELLEIAASGDTSFGLDDGGAPTTTTAAVRAAFNRSTTSTRRDQCAPPCRQGEVSSIPRKRDGAIVLAESRPHGEARPNFVRA